MQGLSTELFSRGRGVAKVSNLLLVCSKSLVMRLSGACVTAGPSLADFLPGFFAVDILFVPFFLVDDFLLVAFFAVVVDDDFLLLVATLDFSLPLAYRWN